MGPYRSRVRRILVPCWARDPHGMPDPGKPIIIQHAQCAYNPTQAAWSHVIKQVVVMVVMPNLLCKSVQVEDCTLLLSLLPPESSRD